MSTFEPVNALHAFRALLQERKLSESALPLRSGFEAMFDFYRDLRASGCALQHADMLLFQWGTNERFLLPRAAETVEGFDLGITRQLIPEGGDDDDIFQLSLTFVFEPTKPLRALGHDHRWCHSLQELPDFQQAVLGSAPFVACEQYRVRRTVLEYQCAG